MTYDLIFNDTHLQENFNCEIFPVDTDFSPAREMEFIDVPGRNGSLIVDGGKYPNVEMTYTAVFFKNTGATSKRADAMSRNFLSFLAAQTGYQRLIDLNNHYNEIYYAAVSKDMEPIVTNDRKMIKVTFTFSRKPQRYLAYGLQHHETGSKSSSETTSVTITNSYDFPSQPDMLIVGTGAFWVNSQRIEIASGVPATGIHIDSELMECYFGSHNFNSYVTFSDNKFPELQPGDNQLSFGAGITSWDILPRWWRL